MEFWESFIYIRTYGMNEMSIPCWGRCGCEIPGGGFLGIDIILKDTQPGVLLGISIDILGTPQIL